MKNYFGEQYSNEEIIALRQADLICYENRLKSPDINEATKIKCRKVIEDIKIEIKNLLNAK